MRLGLGLGFSRYSTNGGSSGFYLEAIPTTDTTGTSGVISQLYTNLTGTLTYSKVSGDARISINASTGAISTSTPIYLTDSATFIAKVLDTVSGTYIEAPITLIGSVAGFEPSTWAKAIEWWDASDNTKVFSDAAATTPATAGSSDVGAIVGKKAGIALANSTTAKQPAYVTDANGNKAIAFTAANLDYLSTTNTTIVNNFSGNDNGYAIIGRFKRGTPGVSETPIGVGEYNNNYIRHYFGAANAVGALRMVSTTPTNPSYTNTAVSESKWYTVAWIFSGTSMVIRVDGAVVDTVALDTATIPVYTFQLGVQSLDATLVGFGGRFGEMFVCNTLSPSDPDIPLVENYLTTKWPN